jgi:hypothetical protein
VSGENKLCDNDIDAFLDLENVSYAYFRRWWMHVVATFWVGVCLLFVASCAKSEKATDGQASSGNIGTVVVSHDMVLLLPIITGGQGGWCITIKPEACPEIRTTNGQVITENWSGGGPPPVSYGFALTTDRVTAVLVAGGPAIATRSESVLPDHLRSVVVELRDAPLRYVPEFKLEMPVRPLRSLYFTPLGSKNAPIRPNAIRRFPQEFTAPGIGWNAKVTAPLGICGLHVEQVDGLKFEAGFVVTKIKSHTGLLGRPFLSCASESYSFAGWPLVASVLVDAADPGSSPSALPGMESLTGHPGVFQTVVAGGDAVARRIPGAWIVVAKGKGLSQRLTLLEHLRAAVRL